MIKEMRSAIHRPHVMSMQADLWYSIYAIMIDKICMFLTLAAPGQSLYVGIWRL